MGPRINDPIDLINALNKTEKRYITMLAQKLGKTGKKKEKHLKLFEILNTAVKVAEKKQDDNQKSTLLKILEIEKSKDKEKLFSAVNIDRLFHFMLDALRQYNAEDPKVKLENSIQNTRLLLEKRLFGLAEKHLQKVKKSITNDLVGTPTYSTDLKAIEITLLEKRLLLDLNNKSNNPPKALQRLGDLNQNQLKHHASLLEFLKVIQDLSFIKLQHSTPETIDTNKLSTLFHKTLKTPESAFDHPFETGYYALNATQIFLSLKNDAQGAGKHLETALKLFKANNKSFENSKSQYYNALCATANNYILAGNLAQLENLMPEFFHILEISNLKKDPISTFNIDTNKKAYVYRMINITLIYLKGKRTFNIAQRFFNYFYNILSAQPNLKKDLAIYLQYQFLTIAFLNNHFEETERQLKALIAHFETFDKIPEHLKYEVQIKALTLHLIVSYEKDHLKNDQTLTNKISNFLHTELKAFDSKDDSYIKIVKGCSNIAATLLNVTFRPNFLSQEIHNLKNFYTTEINPKPIFDEFAIWMETKLQVK